VQRALDTLRTSGLARITLLYGVAALFLVPWVVLLYVSLPASHRAAHWNVAWVGFDVIMAVLLTAVAVSAWRRSPWLEGAATAAGTILIVDAWFDVVTSSSTGEFVLAAAEALFVELPLAYLCLRIARGTERRLLAAFRETSHEACDDGSSLSPRPSQGRIEEGGTQWTTRRQSWPSVRTETSR